MFQIEMEVPLNKVGMTLSMYPIQIWTKYNYWISIAYKHADHSNLKNQGLDKTSSK